MRGQGNPGSCAVVLLAFGVSAGAQALPPAPVPPQTSAASVQHAALEADVNRLVTLAKQLKADVDRTRRDELNVRVVRNADEIDKLARSIRGRIR